MRIKCGAILAAAVAVACVDTVLADETSPSGETERRVLAADAPAAKSMHELVPCYTWLFGSGLPFEWYSRDTVHSGELGKQIIGRVMLGYFLTGK